MAKMWNRHPTPTSTQLDNICCVILAIFIPPLGVLFKTGDMFKTCICLILTLMFGIPGMIYALIVVLGLCVMEELDDEEMLLASNYTRPLIMTIQEHRIIMPEHHKKSKSRSRQKQFELKDKTTTTTKDPEATSHPAIEPKPESTIVVIDPE